jgi:hypothetical protein
MNRCGAVFRLFDEDHGDQGLFLLSQVSAFRVCLVGLNPESNRWDEPIEVKDPTNLTNREMRNVGLTDKCSYLGIMQKDGTIDSGLKAFLS